LYDINATNYINEILVLVKSPHGPALLSKKEIENKHVVNIIFDNIVNKYTACLNSNSKKFALGEIIDLLNNAGK
jgi:hypothetical protein